MNQMFHHYKQLISFVLFGIAAAMASPDSIPWDPNILFTSPRVVSDPKYVENGVQGVFFDGLPYQGKSTTVFAWIGFPPQSSNTKCPAMVLVHGGGGTAFAEWVQLWTSRGYAAIAMDTCGCVPKGKYAHWERHPMGGPPGWGGFEQINNPVAEQWTYHAVSDIVLAHSLIRSYPQVDPDRTGITGISWGGYLTCIAAGIDPRFRLAIPVYGCGFLGSNSVWLDEFNKMGKDQSARWLTLWDPAVYLSKVKVPMLWITGTNDFAYPMDSWQKSYRLPTAPRTCCLRIRMPHGHGGAGENPEEIHAFADSILMEKSPLANIKRQGQDGKTAWVSFKSNVPIVKAELNFTQDSGKWADRNWKSIPIPLEHTRHKVSIDLPEGTTVYYINLIDNRGFVISSEHTEIIPPTCPQCLPNHYRD